MRRESNGYFFMLFIDSAIESFLVPQDSWNLQIIVQQGLVGQEKPLVCQEKPLVRPQTFSNQQRISVEASVLLTSQPILWKAFAKLLILSRRHML